MALGTEMISIFGKPKGNDTFLSKMIINSFLH